MTNLKNVIWGQKNSQLRCQHQVKPVPLHAHPACFPCKQRIVHLNQMEFGLKILLKKRKSAHSDQKFDGTTFEVWKLTKSAWDAVLHYCIYHCIHGRVFLGLLSSHLCDACQEWDNDVPSCYQAYGERAVSNDGVLEIWEGHEAKKPLHGARATIPCRAELYHPELQYYRPYSVTGYLLCKHNIH